MKFVVAISRPHDSLTITNIKCEALTERERMGLTACKKHSAWIHVLINEDEVGDLKCSEDAPCVGWTVQYAYNEYQ